MTMQRPTVLRRAAAALAAVVALGLVGACEGGKPVATMSRAEAEQRVEGYIAEAADRLTPRPRLEVSSKNEIPCTEPGSRDDGEVYAVEHAYLLRDFPKERNEQALDALRTYWSGNGYTIGKQERDPAGVLRSVSARRAGDNFFVRLWQNPAGDLFLVSSSTCVSDDPPAR